MILSLKRASLRLSKNRIDLKPTPISGPPVSPSVNLAWAELLHSLRSTRKRGGDIGRIRHSAVRGIRSAAEFCYTQDMMMAFPQRVMRDRHRRGIVGTCVSPPDELGIGVLSESHKVGVHAGLLPTSQITREDKPFGDNVTPQHEDTRVDLTGEPLLLLP